MAQYIETIKDQEQKWARFYFEARVDGIPIPLPPDWLHVKHEGLQVSVRNMPNERNTICGNNISITRWGWIETPSETRSKLLTDFEPTLKGALKKLALELNGMSNPTRFTNLLTKEQIRLEIQILIAN